MNRNAIYDLTQLFALCEALENLDVTAPPVARILYPESVAQPHRVGILCGSFNPLTLAHTELAKQAFVRCGLDVVLFTLAKRTVDKEQVTGLNLVDRLLLLSLYAQQQNGIGVALVNRGLYFEQAQAFRALLGSEVALYFIVGMDKLLQILDPRYYQDRDAALQQLFSLASLIVANRRDMDQVDFTSLMEQPENHAYRSHIYFLPLPAAVTDVSATAIRTALAVKEDVRDHIPAETAAFLTETQAYSPPLRDGERTYDAYAIRSALIESLYAERSRAEQEVNLRRLIQSALARHG